MILEYTQTWDYYSKNNCKKQIVLLFQKTYISLISQLFKKLPKKDLIVCSRISEDKKNTKKNQDKRLLVQWKVHMGEIRVRDLRTLFSKTNTSSKITCHSWDFLKVILDFLQSNFLLFIFIWRIPVKETGSHHRWLVSKKIEIIDTVRCTDAMQSKFLYREFALRETCPYSELFWCTSFSHFLRLISEFLILKSMTLQVY